MTKIVRNIRIEITSRIIIKKLLILKKRVRKNALKNFAKVDLHNNKNYVCGETQMIRMGKILLCGAVENR